MAPRTTRNRKASASSQAGDVSFLDAPSALSPRDVEETQIKADAEADSEVQAPQGISILKEIFPEHGQESENAAGKAPPLQQLLGSVPSPARAFANSNQQNSAPFGPPPHAPMPMVAPVLPPPPPMMPAPCQEQLIPQEAAFGSYRERLRAGGRGAFQRAFDAGFVPRNMKQDWISQSTDMQQGAVAMSYASVGDGQQMWGAGQMQSTDYCGMSMQAQYQCMQQVPQQPSMPMQMMSQPQMQQPVQMVSMGSGDQSPSMSQMQMPQMQIPLQLPHLAVSQTQTPTPSVSGDSTPTEIDSVRSECMAILGQFPCDNNLLAAQLKASADCQRYED